jgi:hypothetical protein
VASRIVLLILVCAVLTACGDSRTQPPDLSTPATPDGFMHVAYPAAGLRFNAPRDWRVIAGTPPQIVVLQSGLATVGVWRYPRDGTLPHTKAALKTALHSLLGLVATNDPTFRREGAAVVEVDHHGALQIRALETIDGLRREVRSTHLFVNRSEVVIDAFAPPSMFTRIDTEVFHPVLRSLRIERIAG